MRAVLVVCVLLALSVFVSAQQSNINIIPTTTTTTQSLCPTLPVQLELHPSTIAPNKFKLMFAATGQNINIVPDFVDIHYRVNNDDAINLRVLTHSASAPLAGTENIHTLIKQAMVDNVELKSGDVLRAYATYSASGVACDTPVHTFSAPDVEVELLNTENIRNVDQISQLRPRRSTRRNINIQTVDDIDMHTAAYYGLGYGMDEPESFIVHQMISTPDIAPTTAAACPSIAFEQDVLKVAGMDDTYVLVFENKNPNKQLAFVDLHVSTNAASPNPQWDNLRLGTDLQLNNAHKVLQPGIVVKPNEQLHWYWSYRTLSHSGLPIDCTTPISTVAPAQVAHSVSIGTLQQLGKM